MAFIITTAAGVEIATRVQFKDAISLCQGRAAIAPQHLHVWEVIKGSANEQSKWQEFSGRWVKTSPEPALIFEGAPDHG